MPRRPQRPEFRNADGSYNVATTYSAQVPRVNVAIDIEKAKLLRVSLDDVNVTLQSTFGALYVNDFNRDGRVYRVQMQSDAKFRAHPEDLRDVSVRSADGAMIPLTAIATVNQVTGPDFIERFNLFPSARLSGEPARGFSSGEALAAMEEVAAEVLPDGYTLAWSGQSYQEKTSGQNTLGIFALAVLMVFLILAAQYERLTLPFAVILAVPFAVFGAFLAVWLRGLYNDLYLQVGLVTLVGLAAKNAILIVEFAAHLHREGGMGLKEAAVEAARLRFRPIVMTSLAFILGVLPLALSTGAGAASRHSIGTGVIGGMLAATFIAVLFIPLFFVWTSRAGDAVRRRFAPRPPGAAPRKPEPRPRRGWPGRCRAAVSWLHASSVAVRRRADRCTRCRPRPKRSELSAVPPLGGGGIERGIAFAALRDGDRRHLPDEPRRHSRRRRDRATCCWRPRTACRPTREDGEARLPRARSRQGARHRRGLARAAATRAGPKHDWAVIVTQRITGDVHRWRVGLATSDWLINAVVAGSSGQSRPAFSPMSRRTTVVSRPGRQDPRVLFAHSCVTYPGMSGSPMVVGLAVEPEPVLIAVAHRLAGSLDRDEARFRERRAARRCRDRRHDRGSRRARRRSAEPAAAARAR